MRDLDQLRKARIELQRRQSEFIGDFSWPPLTDLKLVETLLPLSSTRPEATPANSLNGRTDIDLESEDLWQRRADAYLLIRNEEVIYTELDANNDTDGIDFAKGVSERSVDTFERLMKLVSVFWEKSTSLRGEYRRALDTIYEDHESAREKLNRFLSKAANGLLIVPRLDWPHSRAVELTFHPIEDKGLIGYVLMVLLDDDEIRGRIRKCRFEPCSDYYITSGSKRGGPKRVYCCDEHHDLARTLQNRSSQKTYRGESKK